MAEKTEINYEQMQAIGKKFQAEADAINQALNQTKGRVEGLHGTGWVGRGSDQFFQEMEGLMLPSMGRLIQALQAAAGAIDQILSIYRQAEDNCQGMFKSLSD